MFSSNFNNSSARKIPPASFVPVLLLNGEGLSTIVCAESGTWDVGRGELKKGVCFRKYEISLVASTSEFDNMSHVINYYYVKKACSKKQEHVLVFQ